MFRPRHPPSIIPLSFLQFLLLFLMLPPLTHCAIYNRYSPTWDKPEKVTMTRRIPIKIELLANFGSTDQMKRIARKAILDVFSGTWATTGDESNYIGETMERRFGGYWMVGMFDIDFDAAYTIVRRSPSYMLFGVNDRAILVAREGNGKRLKDNRILLRRRRRR